jgi:hypothetical protein
MAGVALVNSNEVWGRTVATAGREGYLTNAGSNVAQMSPGGRLRSANRNHARFH